MTNEEQGELAECVRVTRAAQELLQSTDPVTFIVAVGVAVGAEFAVLEQHLPPGTAFPEMPTPEQVGQRFAEAVSRSLTRMRRAVGH